MKKKFRDITVDDVEYAWKVSLGFITIWKDKKVIFEDSLSYPSITPKHIAYIIRNGEVPPPYPCEECELFEAYGADDYKYPEDCKIWWDETKICPHDELTND